MFVATPIFSNTANTGAFAAQLRDNASPGSYQQNVGPLSAVAFGVEREVDHHDGVLLDDANQQDDADERDDRQLRTRDDQREQCAKAG